MKPKPLYRCFGCGLFRDHMTLAKHRGEHHDRGIPDSTCVLFECGMPTKPMTEDEVADWKAGK